MRIVRDLRVLNAIGKRYNLKFDKDWKYLALSWDNYRLSDIYNYKGKNYQLKFFDGCFCPYLIEIEK